MFRKSLAFTCLLATALPIGGARAAAGCADAAPGGEWRNPGRSIAGTRSQPAEDLIGVDNADELAPTWTFNFEDASSDYGRFENTPVVADGCVYLATTSGYVLAINADTAEIVWKTQLPSEGLAGYGGLIVGSVAVAHGRVYATVSDSANPYLASLDQATGAIEFMTVVDDRPLAFVTAAPIVHDDLVFVGIAGQEASAGSRGGYALVDALTGDILEKRYVISDEEFADGYEGASIWSTPVIDAATGYAYAATGNPSSNFESRNANAILKIDVDASRATFGDIVDAYKGSWDSYTPNCNSSATLPGCAHIDVDFGASLNLFTDARGETLVGGVQKSGIYHAVHADTMQEAWTAVVGTPGHVFNAASSAVDEDGVYIPATAPGQMVSLDRDFGSINWASPIADVGHYQPATVANGVVYTTTMTGLLIGYSTDDGTPLLVRPLALDTGAFDPTAPAGSGDIGGVLAVAQTSAGVSVARHTVYVAFQHFVVAYRLPA